MKTPAGFDRFTWDTFLEPRALGGPGSGNFGHSGGEGGPGNPGGSSGAKMSAQQLTDALKNALNGASVIVSDHPTTIQTAKTALATLREMKSRGYRMPTMVEIVSSEEAAVRGETAVTAVRSTHTRLSVLVPNTIPADVSVDDAINAAFQKVPNAFTIKNVKDVVVHEMGHVQVGIELNGSDWASVGRGWGGRWKNGPDVAKTVSDYASKNPDEFIAEAFTRLYRGETLSVDAMKMYRDLKGPEVKQ